MLHNKALESTWIYWPITRTIIDMKEITLDRIDICILNAVQQHGQISKSKLSELVNLSPTPCWLRLARLKKAGLITGYRGEINLGKIRDLTKVVVTVSLKAHKKSDFELFEKCIREAEEIVECSATGGGSDYVMKVITGSLREFQDLIESLLSKEIGIDRYYIHILTREIKSTPPNLAILLDDKGKQSA